MFLYNDDEVIKLKFEENLREARKQYGYLQEELADKLNVSRQVVSKCTKGAQSRKMEVPILSWIS
ncbi:MAG TPA: XRE family transcriptional regulator [Erysipelotrichaceae bacterium]|nr:XRE family transcriptional regulator [Clostridioides difficile]HBQ73730.1 XRE family transcriptional regulator [Erysipelotrichaceae bacterium]